MSERSLSEQAELMIRGVFNLAPGDEIPPKFLELYWHAYDLACRGGNPIGTKEIWTLMMIVKATESNAVEAPAQQPAIPAILPKVVRTAPVAPVSK